MTNTRGRKNAADTAMSTAWLATVASSLWRRTGAGVQPLRHGVVAIGEDPCLGATELDGEPHQPIDELPPDQREVVLLRIIGDLTIAEIARAVGKRPGAVKALQRRGLRRLERAYPFGRLER